MTQQIINIGAAPNDGTGDPARNAFDKSNQNFTELYQVSRPTGNAIEFQFNNTTTEPPSVGQLRFNQATQASTTKIWVSHTTSSGVNIKQFLAAATTGAKLVLQDKIDNTNYIKFDVTGAPVDKTTYWEFTVAVTASGGNLPNAAILAAVTASSGASDFPAGAWTAWTPTITSAVGTITSSIVNTARYTKAGKTVTCYFDVSVTNQGSGSGFLIITLPVPVVAAALDAGAVFGREIGGTAAMIAGGIQPGGSTGIAYVCRYDGLTVVMTGYRLSGIFIYEGS